MAMFDQVIATRLRQQADNCRRSARDALKSVAEHTAHADLFHRMAMRVSNGDLTKEQAEAALAAVTPSMSMFGAETIEQEIAQLCALFSEA